MNVSIGKILKNKSLLFIAGYFVLAIFCFGWLGAKNYVLAGDFSWPISFSNFFHYASYFWDDSVNFGYSASRQLSSLFPYAAWGKFFELLGFRGNTIQEIIFYVSFVFSGLGTYLFAKKIKFGNSGAFISGLIYMFSPYALTVVWNPSYGLSFPFYCFLPLCIYFFANFLIEDKTWVKILSLLGIIISYFGASNSNPAFFVLFLGFIFFVFFYFYCELIDIRGKLFKNLFLFLILYLFTNAYWIVPFAYDIGNQFESSSNEAGGLISDVATMKLNSVYVNEAFRATGLWTLTTRISGESYYDWVNIYDSISYKLFGFILIIIAIIPFALKVISGLNKKLILWLFSILILGVLLNSGFKNGGFLKGLVDIIFFSDYLVRAYRSIYLKFGVLLVFPIAFLAGYSLDLLRMKNEKIKLVSLTIFCFLFLFFMARPFFSGQIIKKTEGSFISSFAVSIPDEYYHFKSIVENMEIDGRYLSFPIPKSYNLSLKWGDAGFQGADFLRFFLKKPLIFMNNGNFIIKSIVDVANKEDENVEKKLYGLLGVSYVFFHKDLNEIYANEYLTNKTTSISLSDIVYDSKYFKVASIGDNYFLPHFYTPQNTIISKRPVDELPKIVSSPDWLARSAMFFEEQNQGKEEVLKQINTQLSDAQSSDWAIAPAIEFKKINPTKYRVRVHGAEGVFPVVFSESFNDGWKSYLVNQGVDSRLRGNDTLGGYKILDGNSEDQATKEELQDDIDNGYVTTLGDGKEKTIEHMKWEDGKERLDYVEKYSIDFVSKNFQGTIQNDNLPAGNIFETWLKKPIENNANHLMANGYANSWVMDTNLICQSNSKLKNQISNIKMGDQGLSGSCIQNPDGSYDFEMVVEFWPQRLFYIGLAISGLTLLGCIAYLGYDWRKRKKSKRQAPEIEKS